MTLDSVNRFRPRSSGTVGSPGTVGNPGVMDAPAGRAAPSWEQAPGQREVLEALQALTQTCAELRQRVAQLEAAERIRAASRPVCDLGIDY